MSEPRPRGRPRTDDRDQAIATLLDAGYGYEDVAVLFNMRPSSVEQQIRKKFPHVHKAVVARGCAAPRGITDDERNREITRRVNEVGETLDAVGSDYSLSRERVRQIVVGLDREGYEARRKRKRAATARRRAEKAEKGPCRLCGAPVPVGNRFQKYCDDEHRRIYNAYLRYHVDDAVREAVRVSTARYVVDHANDERDIENAERYLKGESEIRGRWLNAGSKTMEYAVMAYEKGWTVFEQLPAGIRQQVREESLRRAQP